MLRTASAPSALTMIALISGCTTYRRKPIDVAAELSAWRTLSAEDQRVGARARTDDVDYSPFDGLTLSEATTLALVLNPKARAARLQANAVAAGAGFAGRWSDPALNAEVHRALSSGSSPWIARGGLTFTVPLSGRLSAERDGAVATASVARFAALTVEQELRVDVAEAWYGLAQAEARVTLLDAYQRALAPLVVRAEDLAGAGELRNEQLGVLQIEAATYGVALTAAQASARQARLALFEHLGLTPEAKVSLVLDFSAPEPPGAAPTGWPERHVRVQRHLAAYEAGEQSVKAEIARQYPDLTLTPMVESDRGQTAFGLGFGFLRLPLFNRNQRAIAEARGRRDVLRARFEGAMQGLVIATRQAEIELDLASSRMEALAALNTQVDAQIARLVTLSEQGELDVLVLRHILQTGLESRLALSQARQAQAMAKVRLAALRAVVAPTVAPTSTPNDGGQR